MKPKQETNNGRPLDEAGAKHITNICSIASGLLASGHFTKTVYINDEEDEEAAPRAKHWDAGKKDWKADGHSRRFHRYVVEEAIEIYREIIEAENEYCELGLEFGQPVKEAK